MRWSWKIGRLAGIRLEVHATFLILLAWIAYAYYRQTGQATAAIAGVLFILAVFASVVLHELGHALTARRFGVRTRAITLLPIGGVAQLERMPEKPSQELAIAAAGPAVTIAIVIAIYAVIRVGGFPMEMPENLMDGRSFLARIMWINVILALFNLLPAFPMDGGRILRAFLAMRMNYARATGIAAQIGKGFAVLFAIFGLFVVGNPFLVLIALFVWLGASGEAMAVQMKSVVSDVHVSNVMATDVRTLSPDDSLLAAVEQVRSGFQHDFPVTYDHTVTGILTREALLKALAEGGQDLPVSQVMQRSFISASPDEPLEDAIGRLQSCHCRTLPVLVHGGELVGLLTMEKVGEFVSLQAAAARGDSEATDLRDQPR